MTGCEYNVIVSSSAGRKQIECDTALIYEDRCFIVMYGFIMSCK